ncbi:uncharacterized protein EV420DRAFT_1645339 [Desarmillaria tabescens]|uniref:Fe2OG dioxygenase domain-containing protein n=1 Tax=Armillaria tabescens TaxID=1929756 RepID=A0AA39K622_ARMTA|nr:uncharacterized protein EV420DRAFT_1645339 [Desarmillaria tabescens]KAK0454110.1 hypothetical protein EV420DRAFT_1645339 [Desarmillaria tabescens]
MDSTDPYDNPAIERIRAALTTSMYTSGVCEIPPDQCYLYFRDADNVANSLNFAAATQDDLIHLHKACDPAPFGRGNETVLDETYRKAEKLDLSHFATSFELCNTPILGKIHHELIEGKQAEQRVIRAEPYKLNVYGKGAFFKAHKDTPRAPNMFGSLVIVFPTQHTGGALTLKHQKDSESYTFDAGTILASSSPTSPSIAYVAFYSDVEHEVLPVTSGARITLTYNLYFERAPRFFAAGPVPDAKHTILKAALKRLIEDETFLPDGGCLAFGLNHQYPLGYNGSVQSLVRNLKELGLNVMLRVLYREEDGERLFVGREAPYFNLEVEDINGAMEESMHTVQEKYGENIVWVTDTGRNLNVIETGYVAYGNEASLAYIYGDVCLFVEWEKRG